MLTHDDIRQVLADFSTNDKTLMCAASPCFLDAWKNATQRQEIREHARRFLLTTNCAGFVVTNNDPVINDELTWLFGYDYTLRSEENPRLAHRRVRIGFLNWLLEQSAATAV